MVGRSKRHEEHTHHEAWAIPYGDLITLLLAFFVVMYAISSVNEGKYRVLSDSLYSAFRGTPRTMEPIQEGHKTVGSGADIHTTIVQQATLAGQPRSLLAPVPLKQTPSAAPPAGEEQSQDAAPAPSAAAPSASVPSASVPSASAAAALARIADQLEHAMADLVDKNVVVVRRSDLWIEVEIRTDILFPSGSAQLAPNAVNVLEQLAAVLAPLPNAVRVEGHTDNVPIRTAAFYSNWELSAARAGSVVRVLSAHGVAPDRLAVVGFGEQHPVQSNDTTQGRNANRRVVVVITSTDPAHPDDTLGTYRPPAASPESSSSTAPPTDAPPGAAPPPPAAARGAPPTAAAPAPTAPRDVPSAAAPSPTASPPAPSAAAPSAAAPSAGAPSAGTLSPPAAPRLPAPTAASPAGPSAGTAAPVASSGVTVAASRGTNSAPTP